MRNGTSCAMNKMYILWNIYTCTLHASSYTFVNHGITGYNPNFCALTKKIITTSYLTMTNGHTFIIRLSHFTDKSIIALQNFRCLGTFFSIKWMEFVLNQNDKLVFTTKWYLDLGLSILKLWLVLVEIIQWVKCAVIPKVF